MPHARTARGIATAVVLRAALVEALGGERVDGTEIGPLYPEPWFDNLRYSLHGQGVDTSDAVTARLASPDGDLPDWAREYDRFDTDYGATAAAGGPIEYWLRNPTLYFEPPHVAAHRVWRGDRRGRRGPARGAARAGGDALRTDAGVRRHRPAARTPANPATWRTSGSGSGRDGTHGGLPRAHRVSTRIPPQLPPWIDRAWFESFGR